MDGTPSGVKEEEEGKNLLCVLPVEQVVVVVVGPSEIETRAMTPFQKKISNNSVRVDGWSKFLGGGDGTKRKCTLHATPGLGYLERPLRLVWPFINKSGLSCCCCQDKQQHKEEE